MFTLGVNRYIIHTHRYIHIYNIHIYVLYIQYMYFNTHVYRAYVYKMYVYLRVTLHLDRQKCDTCYVIEEYLKVELQKTQKVQILRTLGFWHYF
jgi:hypothetical protein